MAKVLIGTLWCGEGDFQACRHAVRRQTHPCESHVIADLPEAEAHRRLYRQFKESDADYLIKVDADMVLRDPGMIGRIVGRIEGTGLHCVSHHVDDFFTARPILGIHCYSQDVEFNWGAIREGELCPDRRNSVSAAPAAERARIWRICDETVAWHCYFATERQAFHYGYHRWLKHQHDVCRQVLEHWRAEPCETRLEMACVGMLAAHRRGRKTACSYGEAFEEAYGAACAGGAARRAVEVVQADLEASLPAASAA